jgi:hypothetical protein
MLVLSGNPYDHGFMYLSDDRDQVVKALERQLRLGRIDGQGVKQALIQLLEHEDYDIRAATVACLQRHPKDREFAEAIFARLEVEKDHEVLEALAEASILPMLEKFTGCEKARARIAEIKTRRSVGTALTQQCERSLYLTIED